LYLLINANSNNLNRNSNIRKPNTGSIRKVSGAASSIGKADDKSIKSSIEDTAKNAEGLNQELEDKVSEDKKAKSENDAEISRDDENKKDTSENKDTALADKKAEEKNLKKALEIKPGQTEKKNKDKNDLENSKLETEVKDPNVKAKEVNNEWTSNTNAKENNSKLDSKSLKEINSSKSNTDSNLQEKTNSTADLKAGNEQPKDGKFGEGVQSVNRDKPDVAVNPEPKSNEGSKTEGKTTEADKQGETSSPRGHEKSNDKEGLGGTIDPRDVKPRQDSLDQIKNGEKTFKEGRDGISARGPDGASGGGAAAPAAAQGTGSGSGSGDASISGSNINISGSNINIFGSGNDISGSNNTINGDRNNINGNSFNNPGLGGGSNDISNPGSDGLNNNGSTKEPDAVNPNQNSEPSGEQLFYKEGF
jgi:hypothetical protein